MELCQQLDPAHTFLSTDGSEPAPERLALDAHNSNVNAVCPGIVQTNMLSSILTGRSDDSGSTSNELRDAMIEEIPIGRANEADDVSALAVFLAGPGSRNITGQAFNVDGGMIMS